MNKTHFSVVYFNCGSGKQTQTFLYIRPALFTELLSQPFKHWLSGNCVHIINWHLIFTLLQEAFSKVYALYDLGINETVCFKW